MEKAISEGRIQGIIDVKNEEVICYEPEEVNNLVKRLGYERVHIRELASELGLKEEQARLVISKLLEEKKVRGFYTLDGAFISDETIKNLIGDSVEEIGRIDIYEISKKIMVRDEEIRQVIGDLSQQIINVIAPYRQIRISDLADEVKLSRKLTIALLRNLISEGKIIGSLDMVNDIITIEKAPKTVKEPKIPKAKPSKAWYLLPLFFSLLGGVIGYIAVRDYDKDMANNLLLLGFLMTFANIITLWILYSWWLSVMIKY